MSDPAKMLRAATVDGLVRGETLHAWSEGNAGLVADAVEYRGTPGVLLAYTNPPVHQVGNPGLDAYLAALAAVTARRDDFRFLILSGRCDPAHAGGDIRESLARLDATWEQVREREAAGASAAEIDALFDWGDARLDKGIALSTAIRGLASSMTVVAICGGGARFGGSAEIPLMADVIVADSRSGMCFSEVQIGLIPGWGGVGRAVGKAGFANAKAMAYTAEIVKAGELAAMGIVDVLVPVERALPRFVKTGDKGADKARYLDALADNEAQTAPLLLAPALDAALDPPADGERSADSRSWDREAIVRRADPATYDDLYGRPLREVKEEIKTLGKPLAPQSVASLDELFARFEGEARFDEEAFILAEKAADGALYRDPRFRAGIVATLGQTVADFRRP
ncbi:MAG: enoyl-CoA hydratase/isomerase family protein [Myxococcota bacterium]|jgi:enoyl-CoA hydratase/carnithine racemase|nr:enoyl-CoA hydratase/isomerase family protein [Myxococcota bacterium]